MWRLIQKAAADCAFRVLFVGFWTGFLASSFPIPLHFLFPVLNESRFRNPPIAFIIPGLQDPFRLGFRN